MRSKTCRIMKNLLIIVLVLVPIHFAAAEDVTLAKYSVLENGPVQPYIALKFEPRLESSPIRSIKNVPERIRDVPIHSGDYGTPGPIPDRNIRGPWVTDISFADVGIDWQLKDDLGWRTYFDLSINYGHWLNIGGDISERNYTNAVGTEHRGAGAALTYYAASYGIWIPGIYTEFHFKNNKDADHWFIGAGIRRYDLDIVTGYDRYDRLSPRKDYKIGTITQETIYIGSGKESKSWFSCGKIGISANSCDTTEDVTVKTNSVSAYISGAVGWKF